MEIDFVKTELQKFNIADAVISKMAGEYLPLKVKGLDDKEGLKKVHDARMFVKAKRIEVEKKRKELKESSLRFGQAVDAEAKRITALLAPIETHLENEESIVEREKERLRLEAEEKARIAEQERLAEIERQRKAEEERLATIRKELEEEKERQAETARKQQEAKEKIKAEQKKIEDEKKLIAENKLREEQKKKHLAELEIAKAVAAEKAKIETEQRIKQEIKDKLEAEKQAAIEAKRQESLRPDKDKLLCFASTIASLKTPELLNQKANDIANIAVVSLSKIVNYIQMESNKL